MTKLNNTSINGLHIIEFTRNSDLRGFFGRLYCKDTLKEFLLDREILQINQSITLKKGSVRGLHFQTYPYEEMKLIRCLRGKIFDVVVDLRKKSTTFLKHISIELSAENNLLIIIPEGCAHGFQTLEDNCEILYLHTNVYTPSSEGGVNIHDPLLNIKWPLPINDISLRDKGLPFLNTLFMN